MLTSVVSGRQCGQAGAPSSVSARSAVVTPLERFPAFQQSPVWTYVES
jgi:hypothetical protein